MKQSSYLQLRTDINMTQRQPISIINRTVKDKICLPAFAQPLQQ
jgi:hypothetical protein